MGKDEDKHPVELLKLIKKRDQVKKSMQAIKMFIDKYDHTTRSINQLQTRLDSLMQYMKKYEACQDEIEVYETVTDEMLDDRVSTDDFFCSLKADVMDLVERSNKATSNESTIQSQSIVRDPMKLPSIPAPIFNGELQNWVSFLDSFNAMFHQNNGLSDVQRLHYLKSCLVGPAAEVIRTIPTTDVNYNTAYNALVERYENKSLIIQSHIRSLFQTPQVQRPTASELRQLHHHVVSQVNALQALGQNIVEWDAWLVTLLCCRLDPTTVGEWQLLQTTKELPKFRDLEKFLANRVSAYEVGEVNNQSTHLKQLPSGGYSTKKKVLFTHQNYSSPSKERKCILCPEHHRLTTCENFNKMSITERQDVVFRNKLCYNCLHPGHQVRQCRSSNCNECGKRHNTKLHNDSMLRSSTSENEPSSSNQDQPVVNYVEQANNNPTALKQIMLATAVVSLTNSTGHHIPCRAILDSGSQVSLITKECASRLHISGVHSSLSIAGIGSIAAKTGTMINTTMCSRLSNFEASINFHVINSITNKLPSYNVDIQQLNIPDTIMNCLADPGFYKPGNIDVLLGAEIFYELLVGESKKLQEGTVLHNTSLGWVLTGSLPITNSQMYVSSLLIQNQSMSSLALTDRPTCNVKNDQSVAEVHFTSTVTQDPSGRFVVRLPLLKDPQVLGDSKFMAQQRFFNLERRMNRNPTLAQEYKNFMSEYIKMGHMEEAEDTDLPTYYLPHHAVTKGDSLTTKTRVVFDGSAATRSGLSLNDILVCGPPVQPELLSIVLRFRLYKYALVADIEKMYRQIQVAPADCDLQRIVYRSNTDDILKDYRLLTVTYGTRAASFLATRCLLEASYMVHDVTAQRAIQQDFYVDDLLSGCQSEEECYNLYQVMSTELNKVGFPLRKWCSNSEFVLSKMSNKESQSNYMLSISDEETI
uniref:CCHC-type domain-containing protein n=1 Tax=Schizaphis graminum TaxID=13262 RepID=A0A2S2N8A8_SCHGA